ncbi:TetR/AcrR family transcriptional regulator [Glacieibacterium frigidum]|uniref:TetR/AcrR family transcriptional regulator n=1 Tax=Glacieibacterium frigidum TaxID=2593303 RepID=A0A552U7T7_9SPHN|nr:TetR/AcrR family transcriptional regulator [Glacieibacterium frigidum]TRW14282.1 TetR/AcrR family transcriptional regulator [Glacieibacterium frigidum]
MATRALDARVDTRSRRYDPAETRQRVLAAANMLFSSRGFSNTGTADIAREAEVSEGSIFYHFGSKKNLLAELGRSYGEAMIVAMQQGDALETLEPGIIIPRVFEFCATNNMWEVITGSECEVGVLAATKNPEGEPFYKASKETTTDWITHQMEVAFAYRGITGIDVPMAASFTHHVVGDAIELYLTAPDDAVRERVVKETVRFVRAACGYPTGT